MYLIVHLLTYNAFDNNPVYWADPSGADAHDDIMNSFYNAGNGITDYSVNGDGSFRQTGHKSDNELIRMGVIQRADLSGGGGGGNEGDPPTKAQIAYLKFYNKFLKNKFLNNFSFDDAINHYRFGNGEAVTVNLSSLDLSSLKISDFENPHDYYEGAPRLYINFILKDPRKSGQALTYGTLDVVYIGDGRVMVLPNEYDFDLKFEPTAKGLFRDVTTLWGAMYNGSGTSYMIYFKGTTKISQ